MPFKLKASFQNTGQGYNEIINGDVTDFLIGK